MNSKIMRSLILGGCGAVLVSSMALTQGNVAPTRGAPVPVAPAEAQRAPTAAAAGPHFTCMEFVMWRTSNNASMTPVLAHGFNPLTPPMTGTYAQYVANPALSGGVQVTAASVTAAASDCHAKTVATFNANPAWGESSCTSASCPVCASQNGQADSYGRIFQGQFREVWAVDRFLEIPGNPQHYNKVAGYKVQCNAIVVTPENGLVGNVAPF